MKKNHLLTISQVADILNVSEQDVIKLIENKQISSVISEDNLFYKINPVDLGKFIYKQNDSIFRYSDKKNKIHSKNCELNYINKKNHSDILKIQFNNYEIKEIQKQHDNKFYNSIFEGDNLIVLSKLLNKFKEKVDLIYIDPPFGTNNDFYLYDQQTGYSDNQINEIYIEFLRERLIFLKEFLSEKGSIYVHIDKKMSHYVKIILDEVFGEKNFLNEITRIKCNPKNFSRKAYGNYTDVIFFYAKNKGKNIFNNITIPLSEEEIQSNFEKVDENGNRYTTHPLHAPGKTKDGETGFEWNGMFPPEGRHWRYKHDVLDELLLNNKIEISKTGNPRKKFYAFEHKGKKQQDLWEYKDKGTKYTTYPTEKNIEMLKYIIKNSSNEGDLIMDAFGGSFKFLVEGCKINRKFIGIDCNESAINVGLNNFAESKIPVNYFKVIEKDA